MINRRLWAVLIVMLSLGGCASQQAVDEQASIVQSNEAFDTTQKASDHTDPRDPLEGFNRAMWDFNYDVLDKYILRPVTVAYVDVMPQPARSGLLNMAENLEEPSNAVNNLLQGKVGGTMVSVGRFVLNSTVGLLGLIDVASEIGLDQQQEEFGEVLGVYGVGTGPYLMIPAMGPNDLRSLAGDVVDSSYFPLQDLNFYVAALRTGIKVVEARAQLIEQEAQLDQSLDPYAFVKNAYFQNLEFKVSDGEAAPKPEELKEDEEDFESFLDEL
jgi:phospholipid-binding lipoprotein MlaA